MTALFKLSEVQKHYGDRQVLNLQSLEIESGHVYSILGPNGAGKTTLLRIMSLLTTNDTGTVEVFGEKVQWNQSQLLRLRRQMAMVTQSSFMFEGSVAYNVAYGLNVRRTPEKIKQIKVNECLELLGMQSFKDYRARNLSGGERQKVAIARALAIDPKVLFLDEPTSNIDPGSAMEIEEHIRLINSEQGTTILLITHNLFQARRLAEEVAVLWEGRLIEQGRTMDVFTHSSDHRARSFLQGEF